jgi:hypothetical protein
VGILSLTCLWAVLPSATWFDEPRSANNLESLPTLATRPTPPGPEGPYSLQGTVLDAASARPLAGVAVSVTNEDLPSGVWKTTTDSSGWWSTRNLPAGRFFAYVEPPGYKATTTGWPLIRLSDARPHRTVQILVSRGTTNWSPGSDLSSVPSSDERDPVFESRLRSSILEGTVAGTTPSVVMMLRRGPQGKVTCAGWSGVREGEFEIPPLPAGLYRVVAVRWCPSEAPMPVESLWARATPIALHEEERKYIRLSAP